MSDTSGLTMQVAEWVAAQRTRDLPPEVTHHVKRLVLDHLAGVVASATTPVSQAVAAHAAESYGGDQAVAIGAGRLSALGAAFVNGTSAHGLEVDDGYTPGSVHPSAVALPAVLAAAQKHGSSPERTLTAAAVALELTCRIAAAGHPSTWRNHFHNTPLAGVVAAAAGVSVLLDADTLQVADALGIAGSHAGGLFEFLGQSAEVKRVHAGKAARDGIVSAELAAAGVSGPRTVLEGTHGYFAAFARDEWDVETVRDGLGERWALLGTYVKPYPSCRHLHGPLDATLALRAEHGLTATDVESAHVGTYAVATHHSHTEVAGLLDAQMSIPYAVAVALVCGEVTLTEFGEQARADEQVQRLTKAVSVALDPAAQAAYPAARPATVTLTLVDGRTLSRTVEQPYGEPTNPMSDQALTEKFHGLLDPLLGAGAASELVDAVWAFADLGFMDRADQLLRAAAEGGGPR